MEKELNKTEELVEKNHHPYQRAGFFSKLFYIWMLPLFRVGFKKDLNEKDILPPLKAHNAHDLGDMLEQSWNYEVNYQKCPSLWRAIWRVYWKDFVFTGCLWIILETFINLQIHRSSQPLCMSKFLEYYKPDSTMTLNELYVYSCLIILIVFLQVVVSHYYLLNMLQVGLKIRISTSSLIYRKALKLNRSSLAQTTVGQLVNLLSNDVSRFDGATVQFHCLWYCPIQAVIVMTLCYIYLGATAMTGVVLLALFIPIQMWLARKISIFRHRTAARTDDRIRLMNEIISGIQVIKMYTWEKPFAKLVEISRRKELRQIRNISYIRATTGSLNLVLNRCAKYLCLVIFVITGNIPTAQYVYTLSTFYTLLQYAISIQFPQGITQLAEVSISIKRLHTFLMREEMQPNPKPQKINGANVKHITMYTDIGITIHEASVKWTHDQPNYTLRDINFEVKQKELVAVVGLVGSGKTTLLHAILKELSLDKGSLDVKGSVSYASQEPWLFVSSIRENILFGQQYDRKKYKEVVKVCALERDFDLFPYGDKTIVGERGVTLSGGQKARVNLARAVYKDADIYLLDDPLSAVDAHVGRHIFEECVTNYLKSKVVILVTHQLQYLLNVKTVYLLENGTVEASGTYEELQKSEKDFAKLLNVREEEAKVDKKDKGVGDEEEKENLDDKNQDQTMQQENKGTGKIGWDVYKSYIFAGGHWCKILTLLFGFVLSQTAASLIDYFQAFWVNLEQERARSIYQNSNNYTNSSNTSEPKESVQFLYWQQKLTEESCLYIYSILLGLTVVLTLTRSFVFYKFSIKASLRLHNNMFSKIVHATMKFFHSNPSGRILNRFSSDMGSIDEGLPLILLETIQIFLIVAAILIVIGTLNPWVFLPTVIIFVIFYLLRIIYLRTSRDVKRLEGTTRSPIYSHLNASLQGLTTIRAFAAQEVVRKQFDDYQNLNASAWFTFVGCARSFGLWLDLHCVGYVAFVTFSFLFLKAEIFGGNVGLAITQAFSLTGMFQWGMRQSSELENRMTCVERVKEYAEVVPENDEGAKVPPQEWPDRGDIQFERLCLKYDVNETYILKYLSFSIKSMEKVGIVGRTGAGKSSIIGALFRLAVIDGKIIIDDIDTKTISLNKLRSSISIIPQEPVLFSGSLRKNLDPFDTFSDEELWGALEEVELKTTVSEFPEGLETHMSEGGSNFSTGQRQLVCLARAIVRNNKILILDEATANVDPQTDALIQSTIRRRFSKCTVLTIAHRLHTIMDSDKVLVMDAGKCVEFGHPYELLHQESAFYWLVKQTGKATMENLTAVARENYERKQATQDNAVLD